MRSAIDSPIAGAEQDEEQRGEVDAAIEVVDLALHFVLPEGQRHRQHRRCRPRSADRRRGEHVRHVADAILGDEAGQPLQHDGAIDLVRRARRQQARREQIALAGRRELGVDVDVDVLVDQLADPHHDVVADSVHRLGAAPQQRVRLLDDALRHGRGARRLVLDVGDEQAGEVRADHEGEDEHRDDRRQHEREEQLAVEAGADLAQQRRARSAAAPRASAREQRVADQDQHVDRRGQRRQLGQPHQVIEHARHRDSRARR